MLLPAGAWTVTTVGTRGPDMGSRQELWNRSWMLMVFVSSFALEKYCSILALSSMSILVAFLTLFLDTTSFWCRLLVLDFLLLCPFLLVVPGSYHSENSSTNCSRIAAVRPRGVGGGGGRDSTELGRSGAITIRR